MFTKFSQNKTKYKKGQICPFLIAILCIGIILTMITVNLGQIGVFRTDVSNAADAGALAGVSILSGALLGLGLKSDMMTGYAIESIIAIIIAAITVVGIPIAIANYIAFIVKQYATLFQAWGESRLAWTNAKQTTITYAFNNAGVDEPRPTFAQFLEDAYKIKDYKYLSSSQITAYYDEYLKGESKNSLKYARSGFAKFMEDDEKGYWNNSFGRVHPGSTSRVIITHGYGWEQMPDSERFYFSYCNSENKGMGKCNRKPGAKSYKDYENYVEVEIMGASMYPLALDSIFADLFVCIEKWVEENIKLPWWLEWLKEPIKWVLRLIAWIFKTLLPTHLTMGNGRDDDMEKFTTKNLLRVKVSRGKKDQNLGLWVFSSFLSL